MKNKILFAAIFLAGALGFGAWLWMSQSRTVSEIRELADKVDLEADVGVDLSLRGIELTQGEEGRTQWRLTAKNAKYLQEEGRVLVEEPEVTYFLADGDRLTVTAPQGEVRQESQQADLWPEVKGQYAGSDISAERLSWTGEDSAITLSGNVEMDNPRMRFSGSTLRFSFEKKTLDASGGVLVVLKGAAPQGGTTP